MNQLRFGDLFRETEGLICVIEDEAVMTNNYRRQILKAGTVDVCRACRRPGESLRHVTSSCFLILPVKRQAARSLNKYDVSDPSVSDVLGVYDFRNFMKRSIK